MTQAERIYALKLLLRTLDDPYPGPVTLRLASLPGPAPSGRVPCSCGRGEEGRRYVGTDDEGKPRLEFYGGKDWRGAFDCPLCHGSGFRLPLTVLGEQGVQADEAGHVFDLMTYGADRSGRQKPPVAVKERERDEETFPWERRPTVYRQLLRALEVLYQRDYIAHQILERGYRQGRYGFDQDGNAYLGPTWEAAAERGLRILDKRLGELRLPAGIRERVDADLRYQAARKGRAAGKSLRALERDLGIDRRKLRKAVA